MSELKAVRVALHVHAFFKGCQKCINLEKAARSFADRPRESFILESLGIMLNLVLILDMVSGFSSGSFD